MTSAPAATQEGQASNTVQTARFRRGDRVFVRAGNLRPDRSWAPIAAIVKEAPRTPAGLYLLHSEVAGWFSARQNLMELDPEHANIIEAQELPQSSRRHF